MNKELDDDDLVADVAKPAISLLEFFLSFVSTKGREIDPFFVGGLCEVELHISPFDFLNSYLRMAV